MSDSRRERFRCAGVNEEVARVCTLRDGLVADPEDCSRYYWCAGGRTHRLRCARGQYFHAVAGLCEYGDPQHLCQEGVGHGAHRAPAAHQAQQAAPAGEKNTVASRDLVGG